ncbi:permease-like cell division protein FtsX [Nonomuraea aridisoli]|uniref:FtsX extracellular domain-containing protein n=1 Tax=Nonomuraea aridisoli TaxID=2070368 RepID=A0A2W2EGA9_9ACTN|nr:permease-like cell division protein FtsX [Nonomuraea aridisoli]PZG12610.1 hypothetical protein C1J01_32410 [Nonomuraea aridisoli]
MSSPVEDRLREALAEAGASLDESALRPLRAPERRRFQVDFRLLAAAGVVVVAGATVAVGLGGPGNEDRAVVASPPSPPTEMAVFLCTPASPGPSCQGRAITPSQTKALEIRLKGLPQVETVAFIDQATAYEGFRKTFAHNRKLLDEVKIADLPPSFRLKTRPGADPVQLDKSLRGVAGIQNIADLGAAAKWEPSSTADISVFLCNKDSAVPECGAEHETRDNGDQWITKEGKETTMAQRKAIRAKIDEMPEVKSYVFEDRKTVYENFRSEYADNERLLAATKVADMPEVFRIELKEESAEGDVVKELRRQPGVGRVVYSPCLFDLALAGRFGVFLEDDKVCTGDK